MYLSPGRILGRLRYTHDFWCAEVHSTPSVFDTVALLAGLGVGQQVIDLTFGSDYLKPVYDLGLIMSSVAGFSC